MKYFAISATLVTGGVLSDWSDWSYFLFLPGVNVKNSCTFLAFSPFGGGGGHVFFIFFASFLVLLVGS